MTDFTILPTAPADIFPTFDRYLTQLLFNRGITDSAAAESFLFPSYENGQHDPFLLHDMETAVKRILGAISANEIIVVFSDYDCDGIPGAVVMHDFFTTIGYSNFSIHIPHRHYDGFGLSVKAVEQVIEKHSPALIITIDCGTSDLEAIALAKVRGVDVIVTDHHEPKATLPEAVAVVNPKVGDTYPFNGLCGAGVVFKLVQALIARGGFAIAPGQEKWWLDMVGLATIADMVPLRGENRVFAQFGLMVLRKTRRPGLQQLLKSQKASQQHLTEDDIGFTIGPRINAASRMDTPEEAFNLLSTKDEGEAGAHLLKLEELNQSRKTAVAQMTKEAHARLKTLPEIPALIILGNPDWRPSLVGLVANKLAEEHRRPAFVWGRDGNGVLKGSCRSGSAISVVTLMEEVADSFHESGGHHASGGFSVKEDAIHTLSERLLAAHAKKGDALITPHSLKVDMELTLDEISNTLLATQRRLAPFGAANHKPLFLIRAVTPNSVDVFGKTKEHTKLTFTTSGRAKEAIAFFRLPDTFSITPSVDTPCNLLCHLEESFFMGRLQTRLRIVEVV